MGILERSWHRPVLPTAALEGLITWSGPIIRYRPDPTFCLDLPGGDTTAGNHPWLWKCTRLINQGWVLWGGVAAIASAADNSKCLTNQMMNFPLVLLNFLVMKTILILMLFLMRECRKRCNQRRNRHNTVHAVDTETRWSVCKVS